MSDKITPFFRDVEQEWSHMSYPKKLHFLRLLRRDSIEHGMNGGSWVDSDWQRLAQEDELNVLPSELGETMRKGFETYGFLVPFIT